MIRKDLPCLFLSGLIFIISGTIQAQTTARSLGMGGAYTALARGVHAADWNPANLGLPDNPGFSMSFIAVGINAGNNSFKYSTYQKYNGSTLSASDVNNILDMIPDHGFQMGLDVHLRALSFSVKRFALTLGGDVGSYVQLDKSLFDIAFKGNAINQTHTLNDVDSKSTGLGFLGLSYGHPVYVEFAEDFSIGASFNLIYGGVYSDVQKAEMQLTTHEFGFDLDGSYKARTAQGGVGWDFSLGAAARMNEKLTLSLGLSHLIGRIPWNTNVKLVSGYVRGDTVAVYDFSHDNEGAIADSSWESDIQGFATRLPIVMKSGILYTQSGYVLTADYIQGFMKGSDVGTMPRLSLGTEWSRLRWLPLRAGVTLGGRIGWGSAFGFGLRLGSFSWDMAIMNRGFITNGSSKGVVVATEFGLNL